MLRPQDTATRERTSLNGLWRFALDADGVGRDEGWWNGPLAGAREVPVPASYNDIFADFATAPGIMRVGGNRKGVFTRDRCPRAAPHPLRRRWRGPA